MIVSFITNFGDLAILLPLVAIFALWLLAVQRPSALLWWLLAVSVCIGGTGILKMYFYVCPLTANLHSPSGHTAFSTLVYGALTVVAVLDMKGWWRGAIAALGLIFVTGIAISRVLINAHSVAEIVFGFVIGGISLALFAYGYRRHPAVDHRLWLLLATCAATMLLLNGDQVRAEELLHRLAVYFNVASIGCMRV